MEKIKCPFCNTEFKVLWPHLNAKHQIDDMKIFRQNFPDVQLVSTELKKIHYKNAISRGFGKSNKGKKCTEDQKQKMKERMLLNNPFRGQKHTEETRQKMSKNHADIKGDKNPYLRSLQNPENRKRASERKKAQWDNLKKNPEKYAAFCEHRSKVSAELMQKGLMPSNKNHCSGHFYSERQDKNILYRSSYEHRFLSICEKNIEIKEFDTCHFSLPYNFNDKKKNYIPDFKVSYINDTCSLVEIKPFNLLHDPQNRKKFETAEKFCQQNNFDFLLITEKDLFSSYREKLDYSKNLKLDSSLSNIQDTFSSVI